MDKIVETVKPGKKLPANKDWKNEIAAAKNEVPTLSQTRTLVHMYIYIHADVYITYICTFIHMSVHLYINTYM